MVFSQVEFDELMRSGTTMKVSLTPDRLKSFEVRAAVVFIFRGIPAELKTLRFITRKGVSVAPPNRHPVAHHLPTTAATATVTAR